MRTRSFRLLTFLLLAASLLLACDLGTSTGGTSAKPTILIQSPANGSQFQEGAEITIQSVATDASGIATVDLIVDGAVVRTDKPTAGQSGPLFAFAQKWQATPGAHTIGVRAYNAAGTASDPVTIAVSVSSSVAQVPSPFPGLATTVPSPAAVLSPPTPTSTLPSAATVTQTVSAAVTLSPTVTVTPTLNAAAALSPTVTVTPTLNVAAALSPTVTVAASLTDTPAASVVTPTATTAPTATATSVPPGLYVTAMGMDQAQPAHQQSVNFTVSFLNTGSGDVSVKWKVYIYRADNPAKSNTESAAVPATFPPGPTMDQPVPMNFKLGSTGNDCDYFYARVKTLDVNNNPTELTTTDGMVFSKGFSVCK